MYTNENTEHCIWSYDGRSLSSEKVSYDIMASTHMIVNDNHDSDLIESAKLLLKMHGVKIKG